MKSLQECAAIQRDSLERILRISLLLAKVNGYNEQLQIRNQKVSFLQNSNILDLVEKLELEEVGLIGEEDFVHLLREANVPISLIKNENIKSKLSSLYNGKIRQAEPVIENDSLMNVSDFPSNTDRREYLPVASRESIKSSEEQPQADWKYHDFFVPKRRRTKNTEQQWRIV